MLQVKHIQKHILYYQFYRLSGAHSEQSVEERVKLAESLMMRFKHAVTNGKSLLIRHLNDDEKQEAVH